MKPDRKKVLDILTIVLAAVMVLTGLLVSFAPELGLRNKILDLVGLPRKIFSFSWEREQVMETPLDYFDQEEPGDDELIVVPGEGLDELPILVLK